MNDEKFVIKEWAVITFTFRHEPFVPENYQIQSRERRFKYFQWILKYLG